VGKGLAHAKISTQQCYYDMLQGTLQGVRGLKMDRIPTARRPRYAQQRRGNSTICFLMPNQTRCAVDLLSSEKYSNFCPVGMAGVEIALDFSLEWVLVPVSLRVIVV